MYIFIVGHFRKYGVNICRWVQHFGIFKVELLESVLIAVLDKYSPETELPWVNPPKIVWALAENQLFERTDRLPPVNIH